MDELSRGVVLRPLAKRLNAVTKCPLPAETPPFNQLLRDIQCRRYTLRKVHVSIQPGIVYIFFLMSVYAYDFSEALLD